MSHFQAIKVTGNVWWVGAIDWHLREFHGYRTSRGTTYNAFLVIDEKVTLIDTVKAPFFEEMRERIASVIDPRVTVFEQRELELMQTGRKIAGIF